MDIEDIEKIINDEETNSAEPLIYKKPKNDEKRKQTARQNLEKGRQKRMQIIQQKKQQKNEIENKDNIENTNLNTKNTISNNTNSEDYKKIQAELNELKSSFNSYLEKKKLRKQMKKTLHNELIKNPELNAKLRGIKVPEHVKKTIEDIKKNLIN